MSSSTEATVTDEGRESSYCIIDRVLEIVETVSLPADSPRHTQTNHSYLSLNPDLAHQFQL